ncbi:MAG: hypothetical protein H2058_12130 [Muricauda sp.]|nr:hypothetical protein [Allomuricauda sp.]MBA4745993.1 hypothetical protein [Allomuricauda sp.]
MITVQVTAHPNGNMIVTKNDCVLWSYVSPVGDIDHHASIMLWDGSSEPELWLRSEFEASDFFMHATEESIYIMERRHQYSTDTFMARVWKTSLDLESPRVIWDWFVDTWRIGEGGFQMLSDSKLVFVSYPKIYVLIPGGKPTPYFEFPSKLVKMRPVGENILLIGNDMIWLTDHSGSIMKEWKGLLQKVRQNMPLNRNQIFDAAYMDGTLLLAYWGNRSFDLIDNTGKRRLLDQLAPPWVPHWVAFVDGNPLLFASYMDFKNGFTEDRSKTTIRPNLVMLTDLGKVSVWTQE